MKNWQLVSLTLVWYLMAYEQVILNFPVSFTVIANLLSQELGSNMTVIV